MSSAAIQRINPNSEVARRGQALQLNISAAVGLQDVLRTNLGPKGTTKMCVAFAYAERVSCASLSLLFLFLSTIEGWSAVQVTSS